jgi:Skp family chaperone for outer membrane proteins
VESGNVPQEALVVVARQDSEPAVRCCAIARVDDLGLLTELLRSDPPSPVREAIEQRQQELLAGPLDRSPSLDARLATLRDSPSTNLCGYLARRAVAVEIRTLALEQVKDTQLLSSIAVDDPVASVRRLALERIEDPQGWEVVSRNARNKDKQISRAARERLDAYRQAEADREAAEGICKELEALHATDSLRPDSQARYQRLCLQWDRLVSPLAAELTARYAQISQQVAGRIAQFEALMSERRSICTELEALQKTLQEGQEDHAGLQASLEERLQGLVERWQATASDGADEGPLNQRFNELQQQLREGLQRLARDLGRIGRLRELIDRAQAVSADPERLDEHRIKQLQQRWSEREKPETPGLAETLQNEFDGVLHELKQRLNQQIKQRKKALEEAEKILPELTEALNQGELESALSLRDRISYRLKRSKGVADQRRQVLQQALNGMYDRLEELRQWRHWGSGHAREQLCSEIEELIGSPLSPDETALKVRTARKAWQRIDHAEGPAAEALWQRFDQACTRAYEPYQEERRKQEEVLNQHLTQKQQLCSELDAYERATDWEQVDWREADQHLHKAREKWRRIGPVPRKAGKALEKTYQAVLERLEAHLVPERERELKRRRLLISRAEELTKSSELRSASREVKELQDQWKPTVPLPRKQEQALWVEFRKACDAVFNQLREERDAADAERQTNLEQKQAICAELESLLEQPDKSFREIHKRFDETSEAWSGIGEIPRKQEAAIEARYERIKEKLAARQHQEKQAAEQAKMQNIREHAQLCARLEQAVLDPGLEPADRQVLLEQTEQAREGLPELDAELAKPLEARYALATKAMGEDGEAIRTLQLALEDNLQQRLQLCLQLEVAAGIESPPEYADARMEYQVSLLSDAMQQKFEQTRSRDEQLRELQIAWLQAGPVANADRAMLDARFERVLQAIT